MRTIISFILALLPFGMIAQDYVMYEAQYLKPKPGHYGQLMEKLAEHNQKYHKEGPLSAYVQFVTSGPRSNQLKVFNGPCTFSDLDNRGGGREHFLDWFDGVMSHCDADELGTSYWVRNDELSYLPETDGEPRPVRLTRYFEVADNALFAKVQKQIKEVTAQTPGAKDNPRMMWRRQFLNNDKRHWAITRSYKNWAALDEDRGNFEEAFKKVHGEAVWSTFQEEFQKAVISREDEWSMVMQDLNGPQPQSTNK